LFKYLPKDAQICLSLKSVMILLMDRLQRRCALIVDAGSRLKDWICAITAAGSKGAAIGGAAGVDLERREQINPMNEEKEI
jgi:hypothetical protein